MPVISEFFGIVIRMLHREHGVAHLHAAHQTWPNGADIAPETLYEQAGSSEAV